MTRRDPIQELRSYAVDLESQIHPTRARARVDAALREPTMRAGRRRAVVALATASFLGISNVAMAAVADPAAPGDLLYGIDRAYEVVAAPLGLAGNVRLERIDEATVVAARGDTVTALELVQEALEGLTETEDIEEARLLIAAMGDGSDGADLAARVQFLIGIARGIALDASDPEAAANLSNDPDVAKAAEEIKDTFLDPDGDDDGDATREESAGESTDDTTADTTGDETGDTKPPGQVVADEQTDSSTPPSSTPAATAPGGDPPGLDGTTPAKTAPGGSPPGADPPGLTKP